MRFADNKLKSRHGICNFCKVNDKKIINLKIASSELGPDIRYCPKCGTCADWWMQTEWYFRQLLEMRHKGSGEL